MDQRLVDAAREGDVDALYKVLEDDPLRLKKVCLAPFAESPLHVAALAGRVDFVKHMIALMPSLSTHTNLQGLIPLHMASAEGYVDIVKELLKVKQLDDDEDEVNQCLVKDNDGFTPLHYAIFRGKIGVIGELISSCAECVEEVTAQGDTVLHLAMKANQFGVVKLLMERLKLLHNFQDLLKSKNKEGKTVHQLASTKEQLQVLNTGNVDEPDRREENHIIVEEETTVPVVPEPEAPRFEQSSVNNLQTRHRNTLGMPFPSLFQIQLHKLLQEMSSNLSLLLFNNQHNHLPLVNPSYASNFARPSCKTTASAVSNTHTRLLRVTIGFLLLYCIFCLATWVYN